MVCNIVWFRQDLRIWDNPALLAAALSGEPVLPVYIFEQNSTQHPWEKKGAQLWWLHHSLNALSTSLRKKGLFLFLKRGEPVQTLIDLMNKTAATKLFF